MSVWHPDMLICELWPVGALGLNSIIINDDFATLHHETRDDSLEDSCLVVQIQS